MKSPQKPIQGRSGANIATQDLEYAKTPASAFQLVTGSLGASYRVPPAGFEPAHTAPEAVALSPELRGRVGRLAWRRRVEPYQLRWGVHERVSGVVAPVATWGGSPAGGWKSGKPGRGGRSGPTLELCQALPAGSLLWTTTRSSGS